MRIAWKTLTRIENTILVAVLSLLVILTVSGVIFRYVLNQPFTWLEEVQLASLVWISFLGAALAFRAGAHVGIEIVVELLPALGQRIMRVVVGVIVYLILAFFFLRCLDFISMFATTGRATPVLGIPYTLVYGIAPVSCVLMAISYWVVEFFPALRDLRHGGTQEVAQ